MSSGKCAVGIDDWKLPVFEQHLNDAGFEWVNAGYLTHGVIILSVKASREALEPVIRAANAAAAESKRIALEAEKAVTKAKAAAETDRSNVTLTTGQPVPDDHRELKPDGQQKGYVVLSEEERAKGFVRPVRTTYRHMTCGAVTSMNRSIAETYARDPGFYSGTFCVACGKHFPLDQFRWDGTDEVVGS